MQKIVEKNFIFLKQRTHRRFSAIVSIYHCTSFEKNVFENFSILIFDASFNTDL